MDYSKKSNKIRQIVRLQQILKKWKNLANAPKNTSSSSTNINISAGTTNSSSNSSSKSMKFLKRTLSFTDIVSNTGASSNSNSNNDVVPKGFLAVCVGKELKRFIIPTDYLGHQAFGVLLQEAEDEFGFQQEGVLKIPCDVPVFEKILKAVEDKKSISDVFFLHDHFGFNHPADNDKMISCCSSPSDSDRAPSHHPQMCR